MKFITVKHNIVGSEVQKMSTNNPGVIYDATNSWNGYNHQGKISLWYAITEIIKLYNPTISTEDNKKIFNNYFLEIEYMEDFSIGKLENGVPSYISVHQVKNRSKNNISDYEDAILGLLSHLSEYPNIKHAVLHTTEPLNLMGKSFLDNVKNFVQTPNYLIKDENIIIEKRTDTHFRNELTCVKPGQPSKLKKKLLNVLENKYSSPQKLNDKNLNEAFDLYLHEIKTEKEKMSLVSETQLNKVSVCTYVVNGISTDYCKVDCAIDLLKVALKDFYQKILPGSYKTENTFINKCSLWVLGKLDEHIIDRNLNYNLYKKEKLERRILFSQIFEWLMSSEIDNEGPWYYLFYIKEGMFKRLEKFCELCRERDTKCSICNIAECKNKLGSFGFDDFKQFIHITNPTVNGVLDIESFSEYLTSGISDPFARGLRDIPQNFNSKNNSISYKDNDNCECALTAIVGEGTDDDMGLISSEILMNSNVYDLLMDYDCLISKNIDIPSIMDEDFSQKNNFDSREAEHIAHCKDVKVVSLDEFIKSL